ncbi:MAG: response regulator [Chloroflexi bacterium]|nr:response regulator [Chloroflexota bacterium]
MTGSNIGTDETSRSILVVDDERGFCDVVTVILESQGYQVQQAHHANDALGLLDETTPDLILTDMMMPEMDGVGLIKRLRETPKWANIPVVVISAYSEPEVQENAFAAGATGFISKPFSASELRSTVGAYFTEN